MANKNTSNMPQELRESAHKIWLAGLGALSTAEKEGEKLFKKLVERGEELESRGKDQVAKARGKVEDALGDVEGKFDERVANVLHRMGVPTRDEIRMLTKRVEELSAKVDKMKPAPKAAEKKLAKAS
jgi:polyhydroxyalkanoate synthesis regulator phasin